MPRKALVINRPGPTALRFLTLASRIRRPYGTALLAKARAALTAGQPAWAGKLAWYAMLAEPAAPAPKQLLADALDVLGEQTLNAPARNYTLAYADWLRRQTQGR